jgi:hypothetical protein
VKVLVDEGEMYPCTYVDRREHATGTGGDVSPEYFEANAVDIPAQLVADYETASRAFRAASRAINAAALAAYKERNLSEISEP